LFSNGSFNWMMVLLSISSIVVFGRFRRCRAYTRIC
jgi:hypothetical protein